MNHSSGSSELVRNFPLIKYVHNGTDYYLSGYAIVDEEDNCFPIDIFICTAYRQQRPIDSDELESFFDYQLIHAAVQEYFKAFDTVYGILQEGN